MSYVWRPYAYPTVTLGAPAKHNTALSVSRRNFNMRQRVALQGLQGPLDGRGRTTRGNYVRMPLSGLGWDFTEGMGKASKTVARRNMFRFGMRGLRDNAPDLPFPIRTFQRRLGDSTSDMLPLSVFDDLRDGPVPTQNADIPWTPIPLDTTPIPVQVNVGTGAGGAPIYATTAFAPGSIPPPGTQTGGALAWLGAPIAAGIPISRGLAAGAAGFLILLAGMKGGRR